MGLFSSKKETSVATNVSRVIDDVSLPDSIKTGVLRAIMNDSSIPDNMMEDLVGGIGHKAERMYEYAKRSYTHGLPTGQVHGATQGKQQAQAVLEALEGAPVLINYCQFGPPNSLHIAWMKLIQDHGYDPETNQLANLSVVEKNPVFLVDMVIVIPEGLQDTYRPGALVQWGTPARAGVTPERLPSSDTLKALLSHTPPYIDSSAVTEYAKVSVLWEKAGTIVVGGEQMPGPEKVRLNFNIPLNGFDGDDDYFHIKYTVRGITKYWMYKVGSGVHPSLDDAFDDPDKVTGDFFPFAYFRYEKKSTNEDKSTDDYKTSKKLVKYLGMEYDQVADAINDNPDIKDVEQAMLVFAVPANSTNAVDQRYLYEFFDNWYDASAEQFTTGTEAAIQSFFVGNLDIVKSTILIQDKRFKMALNNGGMFKKRVAGKIGAVGSYENGVTTTFIQEEYGYGDGQIGTRQIPIKTHYYRYQIADALYDEIQIVNLKMVYYIFEKYTTTGDDVDDILLIPIARSITKEYSAKDRETLYARSLHYVFNSRIITVVKWYQSDFFQFLIMVVAVVISVVTLQPYLVKLGVAVAAGVGAAIGAALLVILEKVLMQIVIGYVVKLFVKAIGLELAFLIAVIAALAGMVGNMQAGSVNGAPWAQDLLSVSSTLIKGVTDSVSDLMGDLLKEASSFTTYVEGQLALIDDANKLLENNSLLSPWVIFGESPDDFYNRTVHSGNIGVIGISAISSYVDIALTLPKLNESIGGDQDGWSV